MGENKDSSIHTRFDANLWSIIVKLTNKTQLSPREFIEGASQEKIKRMQKK